MKSNYLVAALSFSAICLGLSGGQVAPSNSPKRLVSASPIVAMAPFSTNESIIPPNKVQDVLTRLQFRRR